MISSPVSFYVVAMESRHGAEICEWNYRPPYNIYGWMPWEQMQALGVEFGDPQPAQRTIRFHRERTGNPMRLRPAVPYGGCSPARNRHAARSVRSWHGTSLHEGHRSGGSVALSGTGDRFGGTDLESAGHPCLPEMRIYHNGYL